MKTYTTPAIVLKSDVVASTKIYEVGENKPDPIDEVLFRDPPGSLGSL